MDWIQWLFILSLLSPIYGIAPPAPSPTTSSVMVETPTTSLIVETPTSTTGSNDGKLFWLIHTLLYSIFCVPCTLFVRGAYNMLFLFFKNNDLNLDFNYKKQHNYKILSMHLKYMK